MNETILAGIGLLVGTIITAIGAVVLRAYEKHKNLALRKRSQVLKEYIILLNRMQEQLDKNTATLEEMRRANMDCMSENIKLKGDIRELQIHVNTLRIELLTSRHSISALIVAEYDGTDALIVDLNPSAIRMLRRKREQLIGAKITSVMPARFIEQHLRVFTQCWKENRMPRAEPLDGVALAGDGTEIPVQIRLTGWMSPRGWVYAAELIQLS